MKTVFHPADSRGFADHGWLVSHHTFSFANYFNPDRVNFGALRVINDDTVAGGEGFGNHPHDNMEIVSIPLEGALRHGDSMGHTQVIRPGEVQAMSAGTGVEHSEFNDSPDEPVKFLQIWIFPDKRGYRPRYATLKIPAVEPGELATFVTPEVIHQQAWMHIVELEKGKLDYALHGEQNGLYVFVLDGEATVAGRQMHSRDGIGVWDTDKVPLGATGKAKLLLIEVPY